MRRRNRKLNIVSAVFLLVMFFVAVFCFSGWANEEPGKTEPEKQTEKLPASATEKPEATKAPKTTEAPETEKPAADSEAATEEKESDTLPEPEMGRPVQDLYFTVVDSQFLWLNINEEELEVYADFLAEELDLNTAVVSGILANLQGESHFNPQLVGDSGYAYGLCQWRGDRLNAMVDWCEKNGRNPVTMDGQLRFLAADLQENYIYPYDLLLSCPNNEDGALWATYCFCAYYEAAGDPDSVSPEREVYTTELIYPYLAELEEARKYQ